MTGDVFERPAGVCLRLIFLAPSHVDINFLRTGSVDDPNALASFECWYG